MSILRANWIGVVLLAIICAIALGLYLAIWGSERAAAGLEAMSDANPFVLLGLLFASIAVHELLHGVGFVLGGLSWRDVEFGVFWQMLTPYATSATPMPVRTYRLATALPGIVLGVLPMIVGIAVGNAAITSYGAFMTGAAGGDAIVLWVTRHLDSDVIVRDCKSAVGCDVVES